MSDEKLLTVEVVERALKYGTMGQGGTQQFAATIKAAYERLAKVELCPTCIGEGIVPGAESCPDCEDHPGLAHKDWQAALRSLGG